MKNLEKNPKNRRVKFFSNNNNEIIETASLNYIYIYKSGVNFCYVRGDTYIYVEYIYVHIDTS